MEKAVFVIKCMLGAYILTAGLLLLLAFMLYRFGLSEKVVSICIIAVYIIVTFLAGLLAGKKEKRRKFLWGLIMGALYFGILVVVSLAVNKGVEDIAGNMMTVFFSAPEAVCSAGWSLNETGRAESFVLYCLKL